MARTLHFEATTQERTVLQALEILLAHEDARGDWLPNSEKVDLSFASEQWQHTVLARTNKGQHIARRHFEVCVFSNLANASSPAMSLFGGQTPTPITVNSCCPGPSASRRSTSTAEGSASPLLRPISSTGFAPCWLRQPSDLTSDLPPMQTSVSTSKVSAHWHDLLQVVLSIKAGTISIRAGTVSSALLLRRLGTYSRRNRLYQAFSELGRVIRTAFLLEYLSSAQLREQITASINKVEAYHRFAKWLFFGGEGLLLEVHPDEQEKRLKYNHLLTNAVAIQNVIDLTRAVRQLMAEGYPVKREDLAALSPYQTRHIKRFGDYVFTVTAPAPFDADLVTPFPLEAASEEQSAIA
jgi:hypothetical protein